MTRKIGNALIGMTALIAENQVQAYEYVLENMDGVDDTIKEKVYGVITTCRFPTILDKGVQSKVRSMYPGIDINTTFGTKNVEYNFIKSEVRKIDPRIKVTAIPKSLYQFIVYDYFSSGEFDADVMTIKTFEELDEAMKPVNQVQGKFKLERYATKGEGYGLTKACRRLMENKDVQQIFWDVNEWAAAIWDINNRDIRKTTEYLLNQYKGFKRLLDETAKTRQAGISAKYKLHGTRVGDLTGQDEKARKALINYTANYILSEAANPNYVVCRGSSKQPDPEAAVREAVCFGDGLGSGYTFDEGANPYAISNAPNKLWILEFDRLKLLNSEYPIHIPTAPHLLSACGNGEVFHARTQVVQAVMTEEGVIDKYNLSITAPIAPLVAGYKANQTPEYFTKQNPQIVKEVNGKYIPTGQGVYDTNGAKRLQEMLKHVREVNDDGTF